MRLVAASIADNVGCHAPLVDDTLIDLKFGNFLGIYLESSMLKRQCMIKSNATFHQYRTTHTSPQSLTYSVSKRGVALLRTGNEGSDTKNFMVTAINI